MSDTPKTENQNGDWAAFERAVDVVVKSGPMPKKRTKYGNGRWIKERYARAEKVAAENPPTDFLISQPPWQSHALR